jgi:chorismate mutase/prephenate dehydratase
MSKQSSANNDDRKDSKSLRARLSALDRKIVELAAERTEVAAELFRQRQASSEATIATPDAAAVERASKSTAASLTPRAAEAILRELNSAALAAAAPQRVAYLGPEFSYSHIASITRFGESGELLPVGTISAVFEEVELGQAEFGVVPLENTTDGRISDTLENFARRTVRICGEVQLRIHHNLLGCGSRGDVQEVQSKPQALSQCRNWLARHMPSARIVEVASTTAAAQAARENPAIAAIASRQAGVHYGLSVLAANIEDNPSNVTRFAVLGNTPEKRSGDDKTALMFELSHKSGALADAIAVLKRHRINLTWLESFPMPGRDENSPEGRYLFFVEFVGHRDEARVRRALASLEKKAKRLEVLGSYTRREAVE